MDVVRIADGRRWEVDAEHVGVFNPILGVSCEHVYVQRQWSDVIRVELASLEP